MPSSIYSFLLGMSFFLASCGNVPVQEKVMRPDADPVPKSKGYKTLIEASWSKAPGKDSYICAWVTVKEDVYISGFEALAPLGTHHTVLSLSDDYTGPDKVEACTAGDIEEQMLYASGIGTDPYLMPKGVAIKVKAGQTLHLNLHLYNISDAILEGVSGTRVRTAKVEDVENLAEFVFAGTVNINVPGDGLDHKVTGNCTMTTDAKIFALWPHMHEVGKHVKITLKEETILDTDFNFNEQKMYPVAPIEVKVGDKIMVECSWNNPIGNAPKTFGDSSKDEMCFGGLYRYPASGLNKGFCLD